MIDKTTEEAAEIRIRDLQSALIDANTTIAQLREENERLKLTIIEYKKELAGANHALTAKPPKIKG